MDERFIKVMLEVDEHHWWYRGRRAVLRAELDRLPLRPHAEVLDAGCGSGRTLEELTRFGEVHGIERDPTAAEVARLRGCGEVVVGRLEELPWEDGTFDLITCLDVIEHTDDDRSALSELRRVCKPGGWLVVTVPAYEALWSRHDEENHHVRRYERRTLSAAALEAGWALGRMSNFNSLLLAPAAAVRIAQRHGRRGEFKPDIGRRLPGWVNTSLERLLRAEARWLRAGRTLPAGLSLLAVLQNPGVRANHAVPQGPGARADQAVRSTDPVAEPAESGVSSSAHELMQ